MIRESTVAGSMNAAVLMTPGGRVVFQRRTSAGGSTAISQVSGIVVPRWVRLVRTGNSFSAYHSADGVAWTQIGTSQTINMAASATIGLAVCSHQVNTLGESTLDNVTVLGLPSAPQGLTATAGNNQIALNWNASAGATSYKVKRATVNGGPYTNPNIVTSLTFTNTGLLNGTPYYYVVSAVNGVGESANSSQVSATPTNLPPILVAISNQTILAGRTLVVTNSANDADGPPPLAYRLVAVLQEQYLSPLLAAATTGPFTDYAAAPLNLTNYITGITANQDGSLTLQFFGSPGVEYYIQTTTNLRTPTI